MATANYELAAAIHEESRLEALHKRLTFGASSAGFLWVLFWMPLGPVVYLVLIGAVAFTPYLLLTLFRLRKTGWLIAYSILVLLPVILTLITGAASILQLLPGVGGPGSLVPSTVGGYFLWIWPLVGFYGCTFILRHSVGHWLEEARWTRKDLEQILRSEPGGGATARGDGRAGSEPILP